MSLGAETGLGAVLRRELAKLPLPIFAVLDGAYFDDLEDEFADIGIEARSLFLSGGDSAMRRDGPWLVALNNERDYAHVEALAIEKPCAVFWSCAVGEQALWRHLRSINEVLIPRTDGDDSSDGAGGQARHERVLFRHWDPNVLSGILPLLSDAQFVRVMGPAEAILIPLIQTGRLERAVRPSVPAHVPRDALMLDAGQMAEIQSRQTEIRNQETADYLREVLPPPLTAVIGDGLPALVQRSRETGKELGIRSGPGQKRWAYLMAMTEGRAAETKEATDFIRYGGGSPDEQVKLLVQHTADSLRDASKKGQVS